MSFCCTGQLPPPAVVFNSAWFEMFTAWFPEFCGLTQAQVNGYFMRACGLIDNSPSNPLYCWGILPQVLFLVTAHVAWLNAPRDGNGNPAASGTPASQIVGRINSATQGSVSVGSVLDGPAGSPSQSYYSQSKYGLEAWQVMAPGRTARYLVSPTNVGGPIYPAAPWLPLNFWSPGYPGFGAGLA